jgi:L-lactate dehydrogenase complex protein LldE
VDVALFVPCYVDQLYPRVGLAAAELLERHGCSVDFPEKQTCCGQPMANSGGFAAAVPLVRRMLDVFSHKTFVVCPSGSCTAMVRQHFADILPAEPRVKELAARTYELTEFLHDVLKIKPRGRFAHRVGLHRSCHGLRELRLGSGSERFVPRYDKVRALLEGLEGIELVEPARIDECCGFGGTFAITEEAVSCAMGRARLEEQQAAGAEVVTSVDMSCLMHLDGLARRDGRSLRLMHVAELLLEAAR